MRDEIWPEGRSVLSQLARYSLASELMSRAGGGMSAISSERPRPMIVPGCPLGPEMFTSTRWPGENFLVDMAASVPALRGSGWPSICRDVCPHPRVRPSVRPSGREDAVLKDFKQFLLRGNIVDLAVAVVIGLAFTAVVNALVEDLLTPLIAAVFGKHDFVALIFTVNNSRFLYGAFLNALIAFVAIAAAVFFFVVKPVNALMARREAKRDLPLR